MRASEWDRLQKIYVWVPNSNNYKRNERERNKYKRSDRETQQEFTNIYKENNRGPKQHNE